MSHAEYLVFLGEHPRGRADVERHLRTYAAAVHGDDCKIQVAYVAEQPELAASHRVIATPMVIRTLPLPSCRLIGAARSPHDLAEAFGHPTIDFTSHPADADSESSA